MAIFGIDSFKRHLDLIDWPLFQTWNGGIPGKAAGTVIGGTPAFAGRNFLGGNSIWAAAEATDAMKNPSPLNLAALNVTVPLIAPIQAPIADHQQATGKRGYLSGKIDAYALCKRIYQGLITGEFKASTATGEVNVWLVTNPAAPMSAEYWTGWSSTVNMFTGSDAGVAAIIGPGAPAAQPFLACVICQYTKVAGKFQRDPKVDAAIKAAVMPGQDTKCYGYWADAPNPDVNGVGPNPTLDWTQFGTDDVTVPAIWRFSNSFRNAAGQPQGVDYSLDIVSELQSDPPTGIATDYMLIPQSWQPSPLSPVLSLGFSNASVTTDSQIQQIIATPFPAMADTSRKFTVPAGPIDAIGRYLKSATSASNFGTDEARRLSNAGFTLYTTWEHFDATEANSQPLNIAYFDPALNHGTRDGQAAFQYCDLILRQPPHSTVFFTVDFPAADPGVVTGTSATPQQWLLTYFQQLAAARDLHAKGAGRYYRIGIYGSGGVLQWGYGQQALTGQQGFVDSFWQSLSSGTSGNIFPSRPWYHANRCQYTGTGSGMPPLPWTVISSADPDMDWGDGGTWTQTDPLAQQLADLEDVEIRAVFSSFLTTLTRFVGLLP